MKITGGQDNDRCIILMYHRIMPMKGDDVRQAGWMHFRSLPGIVVSPEMFSRQMEFLNDWYKIISLDFLVDCLEKGREFPRNSVVITFDDGWKDNYLYAYPVLKRNGIPATIFLSVGYIGTNRLFWPEKIIYYLSQHKRECLSNLEDPRGAVDRDLAALLKRAASGPNDEYHSIFFRIIERMKEIEPSLRNRIIESLLSGIKAESGTADNTRVMLNWEEVREMAACQISFGSHGIEHEIMTNLQDIEIMRELEESKRILNEKIGDVKYAFAYPNGNYNERLKKQVEECGYCCAVSTRPGKVSRKSDLFALERVNVHHENGRGLGGGFSKPLFAYHMDLRFQ